MAAFQFTAKRSLATGYTVGDTVEIAIRLRAADKKTTAVRNVHTSIGGARITRLQRIDVSYACQTIPIKNGVVAPETENFVDLMRMFLDSVIAGEEFLAEFFSDVIDSNSASYEMDGDYSESYTQPDRYSFDFSVIEIQ